MERKKRPLTHLMVATLFSVMTGCSLTESIGLSDKQLPQDNHDSSESPPGEQTELSLVPLRRGEKGNRQRYSSVEIAWLVPREPVDGFIIKYGLEEEGASHEITIPISQLQREEDSAQGPLYRYLLDEIPREREIHFTISSYRGSMVLLPAPCRLYPLNPLTRTRLEVKRGLTEFSDNLNFLTKFTNFIGKVTYPLLCSLGKITTRCNEPFANKLFQIFGYRHDLTIL